MAVGLGVERGIDLDATLAAGGDAGRACDATAGTHR
jgi:hypothetical protein